MLRIVRRRLALLGRALFLHPLVQTTVTHGRVLGIRNQVRIS